MNLKHWLDAERGRNAALAAHLGLTAGRITQMASDGVPPKFMLIVRDFTNGLVSLESLVEARTPGAASPITPSPLPQAAAADTQV